MKKLVGGDFLLDLTEIELEESVDVETFTNITNEDVIKQLTNLKTYIRNPSMIKPIWVLINDGESDKLVVARGSLSVVDTGEFEIDVSLNGYTLKIHIEFTQAELEDETPIDDWYIDTNDAKYLFTSSIQELAQKLADFTGDVEITGNLSISGNAKLFENIVDKDGHKRFIEGDILLNENIPEGITKTYGKWSLSGSHLLIVLCINVLDTTIISAGKIVDNIELPDWIKDKITAISGANVVISPTNGYASDGSSQNISSYLGKSNLNEIYIYLGNLTLTKDRIFRFNFDLLIDTE